MDERKDDEQQQPPRRSTDGVRIIGAEEAQAAIDSGHAAGRKPELAGRFEALECGTVVLVGSNGERLEEAVTRLLTDPRAYAARQITESPYGDGHAATAIVEIIQRFLQARA